jgi:hypothetical protein
MYTKFYLVTILSILLCITSYSQITIKDKRVDIWNVGNGMSNAVLVGSGMASLPFDCSTFPSIGSAENCEFVGYVTDSVKVYNGKNFSDRDTSFRSAPRTLTISYMQFKCFDPTTGNSYSYNTNYTVATDGPYTLYDSTYNRLISDVVSNTFNAGFFNFTVTDVCYKWVEASLIGTSINGLRSLGCGAESMGNGLIALHVPCDPNSCCNFLWDSSNNYIYYNSIGCADNGVYVPGTTHSYIGQCNGMPVTFNYTIVKEHPCIPFCGLESPKTTYKSVTANDILENASKDKAIQYEIQDKTFDFSNESAERIKGLYFYDLSGKTVLSFVDNVSTQNDISKLVKGQIYITRILEKTGRIQNFKIKMN